MANNELCINTYWPKTDKYSALKEHFQHCLHPQVESLLKSYHQKPSSDFNDFLFGVYLYNYATGNKIIQNNPDNLNNWPINLVGTETRYSVKIPQLKSIPIVIDIPVNSLSRSRQNLIKIDEKIAFTIPANIENFLTGIEESNHLDIYQQVRQGCSRPTDYSTIENIESKKHQPGYKIDYFALLGMEYVAHMVKSEACQIYFPELWKNGFSQYTQEIVQRRQQAKN